MLREMSSHNGFIKVPELPPSLGHVRMFDFDDENSRTGNEEPIGNAGSSSTSISEVDKRARTVTTTEGKLEMLLDLGFIELPRPFRRRTTTHGYEPNARPNSHVRNLAHYGAKAGWRRNLHRGSCKASVKWRQLWEHCLPQRRRH